jgi:hypothetical protein
MSTKKKAASGEAERTPVVGTVLPAGQVYSIRMDSSALRDNVDRRRYMFSAQGMKGMNARPARWAPVVVVVDEHGTAHKALRVRVRGEVTFAQVDTDKLDHGFHALRGATWLATTSDEVELLND